MIRSLSTGVQGMKQFQTALDVIGNNLANINTVGYKSGRVEFEDALAQTMRAPTPDTASVSGVSGLQVGNGMNIAAIKNSYTQGAINQTGVRSDLAVTGEGFFLVKDAATGETFATRAGDFREDNAGYLVTNNGLRVQGVADMINAPTVIGDIQVDRGSYTTNRTVGSINTATDGLTIASHGYLTGNQVNFTTSGTLPTSTPSIYSATTYFVRAIDANTISLHTTASGAAADTDRIDFTGTGTGTHTLTPGASVSSWSVGADGKVNMLLTDGAQYVRGQILMQTFNNPQALLRAGQNLYSNLTSAGPFTGAGYSSSTAVLASAKPPGSGGLGRVQSGSLELSNVDMAKEFATMITTQRAFQANARIITTSDEMLQEMMTLKR